MTVSRNLRRPAAAVAAVAAFATVLTACSSSDDDAASTGAAQSTAASSETAANETGAVDGLDAAQAQVIIRTAVNADTSIDELSKVLDTSTPGVAQAIAIVSFPRIYPPSEEKVGVATDSTASPKTLTSSIQAVLG